jgi:hypothetical protein
MIFRYRKLISGTQEADKATIDMVPEALKIEDLMATQRKAKTSLSKQRNADFAPIMPPQPSATSEIVPLLTALVGMQSQMMAQVVPSKYVPTKPLTSQGTHHGGDD